MKVLPESFLTKLTPAKRKEIGQMTASEAQEKYSDGQESILQRDIGNLLTHAGAYWDKPPMNKRSRVKLGRADFLVGYKGRFIALEAKAGTRKQTIEQIKDQAEVERSGCIYEVVTNCEQVKRILRQIDAEIRITKQALSRTGWTESP